MGIPTWMMRRTAISSPTQGKEDSLTDRPLHTVLQIRYWQEVMKLSRIALSIQNPFVLFEATKTRRARQQNHIHILAFTKPWPWGMSLESEAILSTNLISSVSKVSRCFQLLLYHKASANLLLSKEALPLSRERVLHSLNHKAITLHLSRERILHPSRGKEQTCKAVAAMVSQANLCHQREKGTGKKFQNPLSFFSCWSFFFSLWDNNSGGLWQSDDGKLLYCNSWQTEQGDSKMEQEWRCYKYSWSCALEAETAHLHFWPCKKWWVQKPSLSSDISIPLCTEVISWWRSEDSVCWR